MNTLLDPYFYAYNPELLAFENAWVNYIKKGQINYSVIKPDVADSWIRCRNRGLDPIGRKAFFPLSDEEINERLKKNAFLDKIVTSFMQSLFDIVRGSGFAINFFDSDGYILKSIYDEDAYELSKKTNSLPGANFLEETAGTNGVALAFIKKKPVQLAGAEHYLQELQCWTSSAAPILDKNNNVVGALSVSGRYEMIHQHTLGMVASCAIAIQNEMKIQRINNQLSENVSRLKATFETVSDGILFVSDDKIVQLNNSMCDLIGKRAEDLVSQPYAGNIVTKPDFEGIMKRDKSRFNNIKITISAGKRNHSCFMDIRPIYNVQNKEIGRVIIFRKINEIRALANKIPCQTIYTFEDILGISDPLKQAVEIAKKAAEHNVRVIIEGESGTGKEMFAQAIHNMSDRKEYPFVAIDCGALPIELLESMLFGYEGGSFTGAKKEGKTGVFEDANGGTILLDEIENMPMEMQQKLLRTLQEKVVVRVGGSKQIPFDVRIMAASNASLEKRVQEGTFREDLYYRLNVINIKIPSLRERREDIPILVDYYLSKDTPFTRRKRFSSEAMNRLVSYCWPGNVRQLINSIEYAVIMSRQHIIEVCDLPSDFNENENASKEVFSSGEYSAENVMPLKEFTRKYVNKVVELNGFNITQAAKQLGITRATIYKMIKEVKSGE